MNLFVTNTRNAQAYAIIRALRPHAKKIVATMEGDNRLSAWFSHAARSRLVDKRYFISSPAADWRAGRIQRENTEREEAYIQAIIRICEEEKIDTIFPSFDPHVYVFSKNKKRFEKLGIVIPVPDYETVITPLDKYRTNLAAQQVGFPSPRTCLPEGENDLRQIADELGFPLVIKPRFSSGGRGTKIVRNIPALLKQIGRNHSMPMIQEYIPGRQQEHFYLLLDHAGKLKIGFCVKRCRFFLRIAPSLGVAAESTAPHAQVSDATKLVQSLNWRGSVVVQTKVDSRDGIPKLLEINPRTGRLWERTDLGINEPLMCLRITRGEEIDEVKNYPVGVMLIDPLEDMLALGFKLLDLAIYKFRIGLLRKPPIDPCNPPLSLQELISSYKHTYFDGKKKVFNPYFRYFFRDPLVSILWWFQFLILTLRSVNQLGK